MTTISPFFSLTPTGSENYSIAPLSISHSLTPTGSENYSIAPLSIFTNGEGEHSVITSNYSGEDKNVVKIGVSFDDEKRTIKEWVTR
jgi:hypothetical protein